MSGFVHTEEEVDRLFELGCKYFDGQLGAAELLRAHRTEVVQTIARAVAEIATSRASALRDLADSLA